MGGPSHGVLGTPDGPDPRPCAAQHLSMPFLVLLLTASAAGGLAWVLARRPLGHRPARRAARPPAITAARRVGEEAGRRPRLRAAVATRLDPEQATGLALTLALVVIVGGGLVLGGLTLIVRETHGLIAVDSSAANWGDRHATAASTFGLKAVTKLGEGWVVFPVGAAIAAFEHRRSRNWWVAVFLVVAVAGDKLLNVTIKGAVDRVRPTLNPIAETLGPSFPSGHTSTAAAFWAAAALVAGRWCAPRGRAVLVGLAVGIPVAVAASRVLLDVHWLTDVIGGLALGWAWFAVCAVAFGGRLLRFGAGAQVASAAAAEGPARTPAGAG
jgi:membrane-associated phospholipid phosphatase